MKFRELGVRVTRYRERRQLSITQLANLLGVDYMQVTRYEKGQSLPSLDTAVPCASSIPSSPATNWKASPTGCRGRDDRRLLQQTQTPLACSLDLDDPR